jgi:hypothetical protein
MTNEEFLQLAKKNNAILTPEQDEQSRRETLEFFERHEVCRSWDGIYYVVDTKHPIYQLNQLFWKVLFFFIVVAPIILLVLFCGYLVFDAWKNPIGAIPVVIVLAIFTACDIARKRKK